jgi:tripartite-type tricarboxylate transporter receptor subunit TctC
MHYNPSHRQQTRGQPAWQRLKGVALCAALLSTIVPTTHVLAAEFPTKPLTLVVGFPPGGATDFLARVAAEAMAKTLGQRVIVDNRAGANGAIGARYVSRAAPDGYTLFLNATSQASNLVGMKEPGYAWSDFQAIGGVAYAPFIMLVNSASSKAHTLQEFVAFGKANPGALTYASLGAGSTPMLVANRFNDASQIGFREIPYKGAGQALQDLLGGQVDVYFGQPSAATTGHLMHPNMVALAVSGIKRIADLPDVPTFAELGYPGVKDRSIVGIWVPAATPKPVLQKLRKALADGMKDPQVQEKLNGSGQSPYTGDPTQFDQEMRGFETLYRGDFKRLGIMAQ